MSYEEPLERPGGRMVVADPGRRRRSVWLGTLGVLAILVILTLVFTSFWTDLLWYRSVDQSEVFTTQLWTRLGLFVGFGLLMALGVGVNVWLAYRTRPVLASLDAEQISLERYRASLDSVRRVAAIGACAAFGLLAGASAASEWQVYLLWRNGVPFGVSDPQFGLDVSFFVFTLPFLRFVADFLFAVVAVSFIAALIVHYVYGGIRLQSAGERMTTAARTHLSVLAGIFLLLKAGAYAIDRWELTTDQNGLVPGLTNADVNATLPALTILIYAAVVCAVIFFVAAFRDVLRLALAATALLLVTSFVIGGIYPALVQQFQVRPTEVIKENEFIGRNIVATRAAYGIDKAQVNTYAAADVPDPKKLEKSAGTVAAIRLIDPTVVSATFAALEQNKAYYRFPEVLDVDRYQLAGRTRGATVAVRDLFLDGLPDTQRNWATDHIIYTHGYGMVGAYDNTSTADGKPQYFESGIPTLGSLDLAQPRVYFSENTPNFSIVGGPAGSPNQELDYPDEESAEGTAKYTYSGIGGVSVGSAINRLLFAIKYQDPNIVLSDLVNEESRILEVRDPRARVARIAPWLTLDTDVYPAVVDGRIQWIVDGYTTSDMYPNSRATTLGDATSDSLVATSRTLTAAQSRDQISYIRNSVKATVDAYDGTVRLYEWDETDPILQAWRGAFPSAITPKADIPPDILAHLRYPADLFKVQRNILSKYHVTDANTFFNGNDFWSIPDDPAKRIQQPQPPYYLQVQTPDQAAPTFSLTTTFAPQRRPTLAAFMAVNSEPGPDYGTIRILQLPGTTTVPGPTQVQNNFETDAAVKQQLTLLRGSTGDIDFGNLLSLPVAGGVLYVEPVYIRAGGTAGYPLLRKVLVGFGQKVAFEDTVAEAIAKVFATGTGGGTGTDEPPSGTATQQLAAAIARAQAAFDAGQDALKRGDFAAYGKAQDQLERALADIREAQAAITGQPAPPTVSPAPTPSPTPTPTPTPTVTDAAYVQ